MKRVEFAAVILITMTLATAVQAGAHEVHIPITTLADISVCISSSHSKSKFPAAMWCFMVCQCRVCHPSMSVLLGEASFGISAPEDDFPAHL